MTESNDVLTAPEVSHMLGVSLRTVHRRVQAGDLVILRKLPGPNGAFLVLRTEVERFLAAEAAAKAARVAARNTDQPATAAS